MTRAVIFDVGGVLLKLGIEPYLESVAEALGNDRFDALYAEASERLQRGEMCEAELWKRIAGREVAEDAFDEAFTRNFPPVPEMLQFAAELRAMRVRTAILSNTIPSHVRILREAKLFEGFDPVALSCEIGASKPEPAAIQYVLNQLALPPAQVAYIDDIAEYVAVGRRAGVTGIWHQGDAAATRRAVLDWLATDEVSTCSI